MVSRYDIWFGGEPPPTVTWEREGAVIEPEQRITLELFSKKTVYCERNTVRGPPPSSPLTTFLIRRATKVLTVRKADRQKDKGLYKIRLTCEGGNFEATGFVNVLDVPSRPRALKPDEVRQKK